MRNAEFCFYIQHSSFIILHLLSFRSEDIHLIDKQIL